jgi:WD40 repeat protein
VRGVSYNKDASLYAGGGDNKQSNFYNGTSGFLNSNLLSFTQPTDIIRCLEFNDQSKELAVGSKNKFVYIYRIKCANCAIERYEDNSGDCIMCAFSMRGCRNCNSSNYCFTCSDQYFLNSLTNLC